MNDVNNAYWTAVYCLETKLVKKVILAVPTTPAAKLSAPTINPSNARSLSYMATAENDKLVKRTSSAPVIRVNFTPFLLTKIPPKKNPNIEVVYTRKKDVFIDLFVRGKIANKAKADLFVSIHCDSHTSQAYGAGTFVLGTHRNQTNFEVAKKEN